MLTASQQQIRKACFQNHKAAGALQGAHPNGKAMLLFYGAECGLKHLVMVDKGFKTSAEVAQQFGHDIRRLVAEAKIARSEIAQGGGGSITFPEIRKSGDTNLIPISEFHAAMRYSIDLEANGAEEAASFFDGLCSALR
ncbi:MAG TPA: hypothetical protein VH722_13915, partial [Alphaproteobacteria bacterium]|nr:hypothetical protein [Alphaproteobacteria bacterium]